MHPVCSKIFRHGKSKESAGISLSLFQHQQEAIGFAQAGVSYVLTTGTGSGKSLAYFIPIIDAILKAKASDPAKRTRAIIIYPMNALANSQLEELDKFLSDFSDADAPITFGRYTGQESDEERQHLASSPPDILLTNFMMLELLMTRQDDKDKAVIRNAKGLKFLVLDELHTYRGRQGADVAVLVRRIREALSDILQCIGTSATIATDGSQDERNFVVAKVASKLFGTKIKSEHVITETLQRITDESLVVESIKPQLTNALASTIEEHANYDELRKHPLAVWVELTLGLSLEGTKWRRAKPLTLLEAARKLAADSGVSEQVARDVLAKFLLLAYRAKDKNDRSLFAFKLHQFISGGGKVYSSLESEDHRFLTLDGQQFVPGDRGRRLYPVHFCRECGQEYYPVWDERQSGSAVFTPRNIDERNNEDEEIKNGFFMPDETRIWEDVVEKYPETWLEQKVDGELRLKSAFKKYQPVSVTLLPDGSFGTSGVKGWYIPGAFRYCLNCQVTHQTSGKDSLRLTSLSGEGRSSAGTMLTISALRYLYEDDAQLSTDAKKILGFTDNRQDAALQAGHFNDFMQVLLLRSALLAAIESSPSRTLSENEIASAILSSLGFDRDDVGIRAEYMQDPDVKGNARRQVQDTLRNILGYRIYFDLRRGWRFNNPNLEQLGLTRVTYQDIETIAADEAEWRDAPLILLAASISNRRAMIISGV